MKISRRNLLSMSGAGLVGAALPAIIGEIKQTDKEDWIVGEYGGDFRAGIDISEAFNNTVKAKGSKPGRIIVPNIEGILYVEKTSLIIFDNTEVDFCDNVLKLEDNASKYLLMNVKHKNEISGKIIIKNAIFDGNKRGNQIRRYDQGVNDPLYGEVYDYKDNYPGFCLMFNKVKELVIENVKVIDPESWGIAHFLCDYTSFTNIGITSQNGSRLNGDGITGVGARYIYIRNLYGFTNDDMIGISTSRASVQGISVFHPAEGRDVERVVIENLQSIQHKEECSFVGVGLYFSDGKKIKDIVIDGLYGNFYKNILRIGDYWQESSECGVDTLKISNLHSSTISTGSNDIYLFSGQVKSLLVANSKITRSMLLTENYSNRGENAVICVEGGEIYHLCIDNLTYSSDFLSLEPEIFSNIVICEEQGEIDVYMVDMMIIAEKENNYRLLAKKAESKSITSINVKGLLSNKNELSFAHITNSSKIVIGTNFNTKVTDRFTGESVVNRAGSDAWIDGDVELSNELPHLPYWCSPQQLKTTSCYELSGLNRRFTTLIGPDGKIKILRKPHSVKKVIFEGAGWKCV